MASIVGGESDGSYNLLNGGKRFSGYGDHPYASTNKNTGYGVAAGKYQFMPGTWNDYKRKLKLPDFSPQSQEIAALALARDRYRAKTGGNLDRDLEAGKVMQAARALSPTWTSLPGGAERNKHTASFLNRFQRNLGAPMQLADNSQYGGAMTDAKPRDEDFSDIFGEWQPSSRFAAPKPEQKPNVPDSEVADIFGQSWQPSARYAAPQPEQAIVAPTGGFNPNPQTKREALTIDDIPERDALTDLAMGGYRGLKDVGAGLVQANEMLANFNPLANLGGMGQYRKDAAQWIDKENRVDLERYKAGGYEDAPFASGGRIVGNVLPMMIPGAGGVPVTGMIPRIGQGAAVGAGSNVVIGTGRNPDADMGDLAKTGAIFGAGGSAVGGIVGKGITKAAGAATGTGAKVGDTAIKRLLDASAPGMDDMAAAARLRGAMQQGNTTLVPGASPTVPQAAMLPGVSQVRRDVNNFGANALQDKEAIQEAARIAALQSVKDTTGLTAQDAAQAAGQTIAKQLRGAHQAAKTETSALYNDPTLQSSIVPVVGNNLKKIYDDAFVVAGRPLGSDPTLKAAAEVLDSVQALPFSEINRVRSLVSGVASDFGKDPTVRRAATQMTKDIDDMLGQLPAFAPAKAARAQQGDLYERGLVGKVTGRKSSGDYQLDDDAIPRSLLSTSAGQTKRVEQFGAVADNQSLDAAQTAFMADLMERAGRNVGTDAQKLLPSQLSGYTNKRSGTIDSLFSGEQKATIGNVVKDAERAAAADTLGKATGSNTMQNMHGSLNLGLFDNPLLNAAGNVAGRVPLAGDAVRAGVQGIKNSKRQTLANELAELLSDPKMTEEALVAYLRAIRGTQAGSQAGLLGAIGAGQGASGR